MKRPEINVSQLLENVGTIGSQALGSLESAMGGVESLLRNLNNHRIQALVVIALALSACAPASPNTPEVIGSGTQVTAPLPTETQAALSPPTEAPTEVLITSPFDSETTELIATGGYAFDQTTGDLKMGEKILLKLKDGSWFDQKTEATMPLEALKPVKVDGYTFEGKVIGVIWTREINGESQIYLPISEIWVKPIDIVGNRAILEKNGITRTPDNFKDEIKIDKNDIPMIAWEDVVNGNLFYSTVLYQLPPLENANITPLYIGMEPVVSNTWTLRTVPNSNYEQNVFGRDIVPGRPTVRENDPTRVVSGFRTITPGGEEVVLKGQQYSYNNYPLFMTMTFSGNFMLTDDPMSEWYVTTGSLIDPWWITNPILNLRPEDFCSFAGPYPITQQGACDAQNALNLPVARTLLPRNIQQAMAKLDGRQLSAEDMTTMTQFEVTGGDIYKLQQYIFPVYIVNHVRPYFFSEAYIVEYLKNQ